MNGPSGGAPAEQTQLPLDERVAEAGCAIAPEPGSSLWIGEGPETSDSGSWRREVVARLERYRTRRKPRSPRYPTLRLPFDSAEDWAAPLPRSEEAGASLPSAPARQSLALRIAEELAQPAHVPEPSAQTTEEPEPSGKLIEFPRSAAIPLFHPNELAEPLLERPRIVEAPEVLPPPPALGGILIEPDEPAMEKRADGDLPRQTASLPRRALAGFLDALVCGAALAGFVTIFLHLDPANQTAPIALAVGGALLVGLLLWAAYQFLFVVYSGATPGMRAARLRLATFDGSPVGHRLRRWRVLASFLSTFALGLGYLWSILDEDGLCWHDRITHTHVEERR